MRRSSSTTSRCGASSGNVAGSVIAKAAPTLLVPMHQLAQPYLAYRSRHCEGRNMSPNFASHALTPRLRCTIGARNQAKHAIPIIGIDHGRQEPARRLVRVGAEFSEYTVDPLRLQCCESERECLAFGRHIQQTLAAVLRAFLLQHVALIDQLLEDSAKRLFRDVEDFKQVGNLHPGIAVDEVQDTMVGPAETEFEQHFIGIADKIPVREKQ